MIRSHDGRFITERQAREEASPVRYGALLVHASPVDGTRWHLAERNDADLAFLTSEAATDYAIDACRTAQPGTRHATLSHEGDEWWATDAGEGLGAAVSHLAAQAAGQRAREQPLLT